MCVSLRELLVILVALNGHLSGFLIRGFTQVVKTSCLVVFP